MEEETEKKLMGMMMDQFDDGAKAVCDSLISIFKNDKFKDQTFKSSDIVDMIEEAKLKIQNR